jgi:hypothetical protein
VAVLAAILILALVLVVVAVISAPLRRARFGDSDRAGLSRRRLFARLGPARAGHRRRATATVSAVSAEGATLEAAREAKYRELRDTELDYRTGKLSRADYEAFSGTLRSEALAILNRIEAIERDSDLQQQDRVGEQQQGEHDGPAVEVALNHGATTERTGAAADAEGSGKPRVLAGVHEHEQDEHHGNHDLK